MAQRMENWDDYRLLLALHQSQSIREAALKLGVNHSTVSRRLAQLNCAARSVVVESTQSGLAITQYGRMLVETAQQMRSLIDEQERVLSSMNVAPKSRISLSLPPAILQFMLLDDLTEYQTRHPELDLIITTSYDFADLNQGEADIVIRVSNAPGDTLVGHRVFPIYVGYFAATDYLEHTPVPEREWITGIDANWTEQSPWPHLPVRFKVEDLVTRHKMASEGLGMIRGAYYIAKHFPNLVPINEECRPFLDLWILTHPNLRHTPRIKAVMTYLLERLRNKSHIVLREDAPNDK
ncbi:LysR family transcriptional regulator [Pseudoalteromonas xiamenensis]|uniref:LysR family transcriptional regulator n=1 Tax=Pseudoalteromonas xiamenensis TaxID=882626 RepID=UPI0027E5A225|nr:LysR family transcriptional regulator [Pseudoalteromonas xiamenensis]WMN60705.1 LysR family transcriptional regulator [Pseudoalteromonas xiamenensis]WMN60811.1 LysR family transcriptional regulator [Pseudoalteromonas xiamenensis]